MKIANIDLKYGLCLGPLAGVSDLSFRMLARRYGCELAYTEMVSAKAMYYGNKGTDDLLHTCDGDSPLAVQLFGSDIDIVSDMASRLCQMNVDIIDFNMGCPVPKVVNNKEGSALMKEPALAGKILSAMVKKCTKPVSVKIRAGYDDKHINAVEIAKIAENAGISAIAIHGRTREQYYGGKADKSIIADVKRAVSIPVIGNGDIYDALSAKSMYDDTGCDGIMVARGALGNPWIFREILSYLKDGTIPDRPDADEMRDVIKEHLQNLIELKGEYTAIREMRKHIAWYVHGQKGATDIRRNANIIEDKDGMLELIDRAFSNYYNI